MCPECESGYLVWAISDKIAAIVEKCHGCGWEDLSTATDDESMLEPISEM